MSSTLRNQKDDRRTSASEVVEFLPIPQFDDLVYWMDPKTTSLDERFEMMYELTIEAYARIGIDVRDVPMRRNVVRLFRLNEES